VNILILKTGGLAMIGKDKTRLILTIPRKYALKLKKYAGKHKMTVSEYVRRAIYLQLDQEVYRTKREREERIRMIEGIRECAEEIVEEDLDDKELDMRDVPKEMRGFIQSSPSKETRIKAKRARSKKRKKRK
jgi:Arc/MetJ-type ribon-helix-helix transcriptional regulator